MHLSDGLFALVIRKGIKKNVNVVNEWMWFYFLFLFFCATKFPSIAAKQNYGSKIKMSARLYSFSPIMLWPTWCIGFSAESLCCALRVGVLSKLLSIATLWEAKSSNLYINTTRIRLWSDASLRPPPRFTKDRKLAQRRHGVKNTNKQNINIRRSAAIK